MKTMTGTAALVVSVALTAACKNFLEPGVPENRRNPGTVVVRVADTSGAPVADVWVYIELPNSIGSTFWEGTPTKADGTATHRVIPAGRRSLEVRPPAGYAVEGSTRQEVDVVKDQTVSAQFTLRGAS